MAEESVQSDSVSSRVGSVSETTLQGPTSPVPPSPTVDLHALFGIPRPKRPSEKSDDPGEVSESDDEPDSDEEEEDFQEGEYLVVEDNEEFRDVHVTLLAEQASVHRQILLRIFQACTPVYENWMSENEANIPEAEAKRRREQLTLYRQVLDLYGGDTEWTSLTPQQRVSRDEQALVASQKAKHFGQPPDTVTDASMLAAQTVNEDTADNGNIENAMERMLEI